MLEHLRQYALLFFFNDTATTEIYTLSLHDALPICGLQFHAVEGGIAEQGRAERASAVSSLRQLHLELQDKIAVDRKSTRLNSSHSQISYAVFCLKKKKTQNPICIITTLSYHLSKTM